MGSEMCIRDSDDINNEGVIGSVSGREQWHENSPLSMGHPGVNAAAEVHAEGVALAGPAADALRLLMRERRAQGLQNFISYMGSPISAAPATDEPSVYTAILETAGPGVHGQIVVNAYDFERTWTEIKTQLDTLLQPLGTTVDNIIGDNEFNANVAATILDRMHDKRKNGTRGFAHAAQAAIERAEDVICLFTPAIDDESWDSESTTENDIALLDTLIARMESHAPLHCVLVLASNHLPDRNTKLNQIREAAIKGALDRIANSSSSNRFAVATPSAGPGRSFHLSSTTLIVDDAVMLTGAAHAWRRGLVFDGAMSASVFDERLSDGRPTEIVSARQQLLGALLSICLLYTSPSPRDATLSRMPSSA